MKFKNATSLSIDPRTADEARKWAEEERVQLSSYVEMAIQQRNKWHQRQHENMVKAANEITIEKAQELVLKAMNEVQREKLTEEDLENTKKIAEKLWGK